MKNLDHRLNILLTKFKTNVLNLSPSLGLSPFVKSAPGNLFHSTGAETAQLHLPIFLFEAAEEAGSLLP